MERYRRTNGVFFSVCETALGKKPLIGTRVLLVDDDPDDRRSMQMLLAHAGITVCAVGTVGEAMSALKEQRFDVLILDLILPDMRGYDFLKKLRTQEDSAHPVRALAISGYDSFENQRKVVEARFDAYLVKPVVYESLLDNLVRLIDPP